MDEQSLILEEYKMLKEEINQKIGYQNTLLTFTDTAVVSIIAIITAIETPLPPEVYLVPLIIIVPMMFRVAYYRDAVAKISAYLSVLLEPKLSPISWETRQLSIGDHFDRIHKKQAKDELPERKKYELKEWIGDKAHSVASIFNANSDQLFFRGAQRYYDFIILAIICYGIFFAQMVCTMPFNLINSIRCGWVLPIEAAIFFLASKTLDLSKSRILWKEFWEKTQRKENKLQEKSE